MWVILLLFCYCIDNLNGYILQRTADELTGFKSIKIPKSITNISIFTTGVDLLSVNRDDNNTDSRPWYIEMSHISYYGRLPRNTILLTSSHFITDLTYKDYKEFLNFPTVQSFVKNINSPSFSLIVESWLIFDGEDSNFMYYHINVSSGYDNFVRIIGSSY